MSIITLVLLIAAFVLFALAAFGPSGAPRFGFVPAGLALVVLAVWLLPAVGA